MEITIRKAQSSDCGEVLRLLAQIAALHEAGRPDIFKPGTAKYSREDFERILCDAKTPIFVAADGTGKVYGYIFCEIKDNKGEAILNDFTSLYIDDLCVDEKARGKNIGTRLLSYVKDYAKKIGAYNVTLNVWEFNENARKFYESRGMSVQRRIMEYIL